MVSSKRVRQMREKVDLEKESTLEDALKFLKENSKVKFNESVDIAVRLGVDPKKSDQMIRGSVAVPHGLGKKVKVLVFASGEKAEEATTAGADYVGTQDLVEKIQGGWLDFDVVVATPDMMKIIGRLGKILGTKGLMPNPKTGTVTMDVAKAVNEIKAGRAVYRLDKTGIIHTNIGKISFEIPALVENIKTVMQALIKAKPATAKGTFLEKITVSTTMGPGLKINKSFMELV